MMSRRMLFTAFSVIVVVSMVLAGCSGTGGAPAAATPTQVIVNPPVISASNTPAPATPTTAAMAATATTSAATPTIMVPTNTSAPATATAAPVSTGPLVVNGVTMPFDRSQALVMDQVNFAVYDSFNPFIPNGVEFAAGWWQVSSEYLWYVNYATGQIIPWLADSFSYNSDYTQLTINIHKGATWSDGQPFTANDVAFTMNLCMKDNTLANCPSSELPYWKSVTATDDYTVLFQFTQPRPRTHLIFYVKICTGQIILPQHIWGAPGVDPKTFKNNPPVTTGAYILDKTYPDQKIFVWKKNPNYWNKAKYDPAPGYIIYRSGPSTNDQYLAEVKANVPDVFGMDYNTYQDNKANIPNISLVAYVDPCPRGAFFNTAKDPFDKAEFRRAMSMLMDRPKWAANIWIPASKPAIAPWADYRNLDKYINPTSAKTWGTLNYDPTAAKALLTSIGYKWDSNNKLLDLKTGKPITMTIGTPTNVTDKEYLMSQDWIGDLQNIGIDANLQHFEQPVWFGKTNTGQFDAGIWWLCGATVDPLELYTGYTSNLAVPIGTNDKGNNDPRLKDPDLDNLVAKLGAVTPDDPTAMPLYQQAFDVFMRDAAAVPLIQTYYTVNYNNQNWSGMPTNANMYTVPFNWWAQIQFLVYALKPPTAK